MQIDAELAITRNRFCTVQSRLEMTAALGCNLRLTDVHATAETVGREFKKLTDKFGMKCVVGLVPPVVEALERLEEYVESYQHLQTRLSELMMDNDTLLYERQQKAKLAKEKEVRLVDSLYTCICKSCVVIA